MSSLLEQLKVGVPLRASKYPITIAYDFKMTGENFGKCFFVLDNITFYNPTQALNALYKKGGLSTNRLSNSGWNDIQGHVCLKQGGKEVSKWISLSTIRNKYIEYLTSLTLNLRNNEQIGFKQAPKKRKREVCEKVEIQSLKENKDESLKENKDKSLQIPDEKGQCLVCMDKMSNYVNVPCGHLVFCGDCKVGNAQSSTCLVCRRDVTMCIRVFSDLFG